MRSGEANQCDSRFWPRRALQCLLVRRRIRRQSFSCQLFACFRYPRRLSCLIVGPHIWVACRGLLLDAVRWGFPSSDDCPVLAVWHKRRLEPASYPIRGPTVTATIIDHHELDQQLLAEAPANSLAASEVERTAAFLSRHVAPAKRRLFATAKGHSVATAMSEAEARDLIRRGERLKQEGRPAIARIFYRTVAKQATGAVRNVASQRLRDLDHDLSPPRIAGR